MQLVSVSRGHFHLVCVFYKLLVHCSQWEGGPAALDPSPGKKPALYIILSPGSNSHCLPLTSCLDQLRSSESPVHAHIWSSLNSPITSH